MLRSFDMLCTTASAGTVLAADPKQALLACAHGRYAVPWHWHDCMMLLMPRVGALDLRQQDRLEGAWVSEDRFAVVPANGVEGNAGALNQAVPPNLAISAPKSLTC